MAGLDNCANVSATTNWLERWYSKPMLLGYFFLGLILVLGYVAPIWAENFSQSFSFLAGILKSVSPQFLSVRYGTYSLEFYENVLALMFFSSFGSAVLSICLYVLRYYRNPAGFTEFVLQRMGGNYFLLILLNIFSLLCVWLGWFFAEVFYGLTAYHQYDLSKSLFDFAAYSFLASGFITITYLGLPLPISTLFYLVRLTFRKKS